MFREDNALYVVGDVVNDGDVAVYGVTVIATFGDGSGRTIGAREAATLLPQTVPTQHNPFVIVFNDAPAAVDAYELALHWSDVSIVDYARLSVVSQELKDEEGIEIVGQVRNDHAFEVENVRVVVTFYDGDGTVVNAYQGAVEMPSLAPSTTAPYAVTTGESELDFVSFTVQTQGRRSPE